MRSEAELNRALMSYGDKVRRICFMHLSNRSDVEDVFQEVFLKYALHDADFESDDHERAWLFRVAINACKDLHKSVWRRRVSSLADADEAHLAIAEENRDVLDAVLRLTPPKYRDVIYLHYYEGYKAAEIAAILGQKENTIYTWLTRAREQLRQTLGGESL
ncbi:sigma-70 family RNA polymerase sigma factor [Ruminococcaceae bacterium OttesenSCG-928-L11]|nr:sigma-70 family RNA polymerase sigma factor [Ruminococcaceae bacterium OttesenSCG-928-L11]